MNPNTAYTLPLERHGSDAIRIYRNRLTAILCWGGSGVAGFFLIVLIRFLSQVDLSMAVGFGLTVSIIFMSGRKPSKHGTKKKSKRPPTEFIVRVGDGDVIVHEGKSSKKDIEGS